MVKSYADFKRDIEEGPVSEDMQMVPMQIEWEELGDEELVGKLGEEEDLEPNETLAEEEAKRQWERDVEEGKTTESWFDRLREVRRQWEVEKAKEAKEKRKKEIRKYETEATKLQEQVSLARGRKSLRDLKGTGSQRFVQKVQDVKNVIGAFDVKGTGGAGMRAGFKKMVPRAQMGQNIYSTNAGALREAQTPHPDLSLYHPNTDRLKQLSSPNRPTRLSEVTTRLPKGMSVAPKMGKEMVTLDYSGLKPKPLQIEAPKKIQPKYYKNKIRTIRKGLV